MSVGIYTVSSQSGRAYLADFLKKGIQVQGYARKSNHGQRFVSSINSAGGIFLERPQNANNENKQFLELGKSKVNHSIVDLIKNSDIIIMALPSHLLEEAIKNLVDNGLLNKRIPLILSPSRTFSTPYLWKILGDGYPTICFSTCPFSCKAPREDTAYIKRRKRTWVASLEGNFKIEEKNLVENLFPQAILSELPGVTSIGNIGAVFHPATYLMNYEKIVKAKQNNNSFSFYMEGIVQNDEVGKLLEKIDQVRLQIADKLGFNTFGLKGCDNEKRWEHLMTVLRSEERKHTNINELRKIRHDCLQEIHNSIPSAQHWLDYTYGVERISGESLKDTIERTPTYQKMSVPQTRYIEEDMPTGIIPLAAIAERLEINHVSMKQIIYLQRKLFPNRTNKYDRTLREFDTEFIKDYLKGKFFAVY